MVGCYALGKCQRLIALLRQAGWDRPIYLHGALAPLCAVYEQQGVELGDLRPATVAAKEELRGAIVLAPPSRRHRSLGAAAGRAGRGARVRLDAGARSGRSRAASNCRW